jgi:thioredoxin-dependent peroxiredoxin
MLRTGAVISLLLLSAIPALLFAQSVPAIGSEAPEFTLHAQDGKTVSLKDYLGKWVVVYFYPFPGRCSWEADSFERDQNNFQKKNTVILGISLDNSSVQKNCNKEGDNFKLLADTGGEVSRKYGSVTNLLVVKFESRNTFIIDPEGKVAKVFTRVIDTGQHSREVLAALTVLQQSWRPHNPSHNVAGRAMIEQNVPSHH